MSKAQTMKPKLTKEQKQLIDNFYLKEGGELQIRGCILGTIHRTPTDEEMEEYIGISHEGVVKAAINYKYSKHTQFSTFVHRNVRSMVINELRKKTSLQRETNKNNVSLDVEFDSDNQSPLYDILMGEEDVASSLIGDDMPAKRAVDYIECLNKKELKALVLRLLDISWSDICELLGYDEDGLKRVLSGLRDMNRYQLLFRTGRK